MVHWLVCSVLGFCLVLTGNCREGVLPVRNLSTTGNISFSFDQKVGSSVLESCSRPEKWANRSSSFGNIYTQNLVIDVQDTEPKKKTRKKAAKEQPIWMAQSTVEGATAATNNSVGKLSVSKYLNAVRLLNILNIVFLLKIEQACLEYRKMP